MITGVHFLMYSTDADADRAFFRDVLELPAIDAGGGWLIFGLPAAEMGVHPGSGDFVQRHGHHDLLGALPYLMCDDLPAFMTSLAAKGVDCTDVQEADWGRSTTIVLPSGGAIGLYQPSHPTALGLQ